MADSRRRRLGWRLVAFLLVGLCGHVAPASATDTRPYLRVETGVHESAINAAALLPGGVGIVTVSDDKTARLWSLGALAPNGIILPPLGPEDVGALYAVAASEKAIAVAGRLQNEAGLFGVGLYLRSDLAPATIIWGFPAPVTALRFSHSGRLLAVGMQGEAGIRVMDLATGRTAYADRTLHGTVYGLDFDAADLLAVATDGGELRLYKPDGQKLKAPSLPKGVAAWNVAFSPDGATLAIGDHLRPVVHMLDMAKLRFGTALRGAALTAGSLGVVAFAPDGKSLYASGSYVDKAGAVAVRKFTFGARPVAADIKVTDQLVTALLPVDDGLIVATAEPALLRLDPAGAVTAQVRASHANFRTAGYDALLVSQDGLLIDIPGVPGQRIRFDAAAHAIVPPDDRAVLRPFATMRGFAVTEWLNSHSPRLNGQVLVLDPAETVRAVAVLPAGAGAALGTDFYVRVAGRVGELWKQPTEAPVWAINVSGDGRLVIAALGDGTVHWYEASNGRELQALLIDPETQRFVLWTQDGFFDHDHRDDDRRDGRGLIGYRLNARSDLESSFIQIGQLYPIFFRPDLVGMTLRNDTASMATVAEQSKLLGSVAAALAGGLPARVTLLEVCVVQDDACGERVAFEPTQPPDPDRIVLHTRGEKVRVRYRLDDATGAPGPVSVERNNAVIAVSASVTGSEPNARIEEVDISLATGVNRIAIAPRSHSGVVEASLSGRGVVAVERDAPPVVAGAKPGRGTERRLFMLSVGVGEYQDPRLKILRLRNPAGDAQAVAEIFEAPAAVVYQNPEVVALTDKNATRSRIVEALTDLAARAQPDDVVVIFLAGHGLTVGGQYYYAAGDMGADDPGAVDRLVHPKNEAEGKAALAELFERQGLSQAVLVPLLQSISAGRVALILDTCYSAAAATGEAVLRHDLNVTVTNRLGHASGRFVLSSAFGTARDSGGEGMDEHGLFTGYLIRAFEGDADLGNSGIIDVPKLATYMKEHVIAHSEKMAAEFGDDSLKQEPYYYFGGSDFFQLRSVLPASRKP